MEKIIRLEDTIDMMLSEYYYDRLLAEYYQVRIRYQKLAKMLDDFDNGTLRFTPATPIDILKSQSKIMYDYMIILNKRLHIEA